jgi:hypothetical protein
MDLTLLHVNMASYLAERFDQEARFSRHCRKASLRNYARAFAFTHDDRRAADHSLKEERTKTRYLPRIGTNLTDISRRDSDSMLVTWSAGKVHRSDR